MSSIRHANPQRFFSTAPLSQQSRSWKNYATRWGLAIGAVYYYNTSNVFAEEPALVALPPTSPSDETSVPTLESIAAARQSEAFSSSQISPTATILSPESQSLDETKEEASQQGAFNEETGEINWDCPCLGGMAHGPCGENFRAAFSCFVFSKVEPKGMDCIDNFKSMQDCFRQHPEVYGAEFEDGESPEDDDPSYPNPQVDEPSIPPSLDPSIPAPAVDEPSVPLYTSKALDNESTPVPRTTDSQAASATSGVSGHSSIGTGVPLNLPEEPASEN
ncbi:Oxidoreductase [Pseudocyphellaria aurata]|nr:Oxidoreductase [Pseudocyphellaria aurata]